MPSVCMHHRRRIVVNGYRPYARPPQGDVPQIVRPYRSSCGNVRHRSVHIGSSCRNVFQILQTHRPYDLLVQNDAQKSEGIWSVRRVKYFNLYPNSPYVSGQSGTAQVIPLCFEVICPKNVQCTSYPTLFSSAVSPNRRCSQPLKKNWNRSGVILQRNNGERHPAISNQQPLLQLGRTCFSIGEFNEFTSHEIIRRI